jgi:L-serine dehydratase
MGFVSVFNDVLGPIMRGPSSSHTAGAYRIGRMVRSLLGDDPASVRVTFDPTGSYAPTYVPLGVDLALTAGLMGWSMLDERYFEALSRAKAEGVTIAFAVAPLAHTDHPNGVRVQAESREGRCLDTVAEAGGGGVIRFVRIGEWPVEVDGKSHVVLVEANTGTEPEASALLGEEESLLTALGRRETDGSVLLHAQRARPPRPEHVERLRALDGVTGVWTSKPVFYVRAGRSLFASGAEMIAVAEARGESLGRATLSYESEILGLSEAEVLEEMLRRLEVMERSARFGLEDDRVDMLLLAPTASRVFRAESQGALPVGGIHTRAAARSMAVMHCCNSRGVVCAAPTGGSAGVVPGVVLSLVEDRSLSREGAALALFAASGIGLIVAKRASFAAELAGCQVEIGVAGAMAAAAVVESAGGTARQAADAATISLQNTIGSPCDPVAGACEVPCHTRNAVAASSAFTCADLILGGYSNPIPLDETIDASYAVGRALPRELRCTAEGGLAVTPSARALPRSR